MSQVMSQISISLHNMRFISHARRTLSEARDEGRRKINKCFIFAPLLLRFAQNAALASRGS